ncbi:MAG: hypothetical protein PHQ65_17750 [Bacteroidales bacterium]|nr:hypothetical protein [Bacteroidales bacterium]
MDPIQPNQPEKKQVPNQVPETNQPTPPPQDPTSLESFIRQSSADQSGVPAQPLFQE